MRKSVGTWYLNFIYYTFHDLIIIYIQDPLAIIVQNCNNIQYWKKNNFYIIQRIIMYNNFGIEYV